MERAKMQGLAIYESQLCECGVHESIAQTDPDMEIDLPVCPVCAGLAQQMRVLNANDATASKSVGAELKPSAPRPADGRRVRLRFAPADQRQESSTS